MASGAKERVLFLCTGNACRSQMAEGWLRRLAGDRYEVASAGTRPAGVDPRAVEAMAEVGIDLSAHTSDPVEAYLGQRAPDLLIAVCDAAAESCPTFPGATRVERMPFEDPARARGTDDEVRTAFRRVRDEIGERLRAWLVAREAAPAE